jgi:lipoate synthase
VTEHHRLPPWLRVKVGKAHQVASTRDLLACRGVHTVCQEARCPNVGECFGSQTATFMILGDTCTRDCGFCAVKHGIPGLVETEEPGRVADARVLPAGLNATLVTGPVCPGDVHQLGHPGTGYASEAGDVGVVSHRPIVEHLPEFQGYS